MSEKFNSNNEADRIVGNMCRMPGYHGETSAKIAEEIANRFSRQIYCNGSMRTIILTNIGLGRYSYKTEPF